MADPELLYEADGPLRIVTFNRPQARNAMTWAMYDGLLAACERVDADPDARVLILTTFDLDEYIYEALRAGASGFVLKDDPPEQLIAAISCSGGSSFSTKPLAPAWSAS